MFRSWNNDRAILYRQLNNISASLGTAVNVQSMVFGNTGETSGTGVAFTRSPVNGENKIFGEFLVNAQGEDVVAGIRTPQPIAEMSRHFRRYMLSLSLLRISSRSITGICRIWSSLLRTTSSTCCRPETARELLQLQLKLP